MKMRTVTEIQDLLRFLITVIKVMKAIKNVAMSGLSLAGAFQTVAITATATPPERIDRIV
jgi:hypothetical protein